MSLMDFDFLRYVGTGLQVHDITINNKDVVALLNMSEDLTLLLLPSMEHPISIDTGQAEAIRSSSRGFHADPNRLFKNFKGLNLEEPTVVSDVNARPSVTRDDPSYNPDAPAPDTPALKTSEIDDPAIIGGDNIEFGRRQFAIPSHKNLNPLEYVKGAALGGRSIYDYKEIPLAKSGTAHIELKTIKDMGRTARSIFGKATQEVPEHIMNDFVNNIIPALGSKVDLPFKRLYLSVDDKEDTHIVTASTGGMLYGKIHISPSQLVSLYGGFNSRIVAQAVTHELAHFYDNTMLRNLDKLRFKAAIQGKAIHPLAETGQSIAAMKEHFATLAELMVWGNAARGVYFLNGMDVVEKYFENRYITEKDKSERML